MKNVTAKQRMLQSSSHHHIPAPRRRGLRALEMETNRLPACWQALSHCCSPTSVDPEGTRDERTQDAGPRELRCRSKDGFSKPRLLHLSLGRKALNSLTWDIQFSLINSNLLMFQLPGLVAKPPVYPSPPPVASSEPQSPERLCPRLTSSVLSTKYNIILNF